MLSNMYLYSSNDFQQVEYWNSWIRFEMSNPDNLTQENFRQMLRMVYEQCLCAFRYNTEVLYLIS